MAKAKDDDKPEENPSDPGLGGQNPADQKVPPGNNDDQKAGQKKDQKDDQEKEKTEIATIEEHKKNMNISAPVFAAVIQMKGWASGKKVPEAVFEEAVKEFLGAPMDGVQENIQTIEEHQKKLNIDAPALEAVIKAKGWMLKSKVPEAALKKAVEEHLNARKKGGE